MDYTMGHTMIVSVPWPTSWYTDHGICHDVAFPMVCRMIMGVPWALMMRVTGQPWTYRLVCPWTIRGTVHGMSMEQYVHGTVHGTVHGVSHERHHEHIPWHTP